MVHTQVYIHAASFYWGLAKEKTRNTTKNLPNAKNGNILNCHSALPEAYDHSSKVSSDIIKICQNSWDAKLKAKSQARLNRIRHFKMEHKLLPIFTNYPSILRNDKRFRLASAFSARYPDARPTFYPSLIIWKRENEKMSWYIHAPWLEIYLCK